MIKTIRNNMGITQAKFAQMLGVSTVAINKWEQGHKPGRYAEAMLELLRRVCRVHDPLAVHLKLKRCDGSLVEIFRVLLELEPRRKKSAKKA